MSIGYLNALNLISSFSSLFSLQATKTIQQNELFDTKNTRVQQTKHPSLHSPLISFPPDLYMLSRENPYPKSRSIISTKGTETKATGCTILLGLYDTLPGKGNGQRPLSSGSPRGRMNLPHVAAPECFSALILVLIEIMEI